MKGEITAGDGWTMRWDLSDAECQEIAFHKPDGTRHGVVSGEILEGYLKRERARFLKEHDGQAKLWSN